MLNRNALLLVAGAAIFALDAPVASAQAKPPVSTKRIPITKEAPGEVIPPRVDSVMVYRTDTLRLPGRTDTVVTTKTLVRVDTVQMPPIPVVLTQIGGFYFGGGVGSSFPAANFNDSDKPGWRLEGLIGVDPIGSWIGGRLSAGYAQYSPHSYAEPFIDNAKLFTAALDAKLRLPAISPLAKRVQVYAIVGGTYNRFKDILENDHGILSIGNNISLTPGVFPTPDHDWHNGWGYNLGGGAEVGWGRTNLFVESRFSRFQGENTNISHVPVVIGVSWF
jgi:hypothetical protein